MKFKKTTHYLLIFLFVLGCGFANAQQSEIDSLKRLVKKERKSSKKTEYFYQLGDFYQHSRPDSALYYYAVAKNFAKTNKNELGEARYGQHAIPVLNKQGKFREALLLAEESAELYKKLKMAKDLGTTYLTIGSQWQYLSDFKTASEYYLKAKKIIDSLQDKITQRTVNSNLGSVFTEMRQYEKAKEYSLQALQLAKENKNLATALSPLYNLAVNAKYHQKFDEGIAYINQFEKIAKDVGSPYDVIDGYLAKGNFLGQTNLQEGVKYLKRTIRESQKINFPEDEMYAYLYLAEIYLIHNKYKEAIESIKTGIPLAEKLETKYELADFHKKASESYEKLGEFEKALSHNRQYEKLNAEIQLDENKKQLIAFEAKYQFKQKEAEIRTLNAEKQTQTLKIRQKSFLNFALGAALLVAGIIVFLLYKNYKNKQKIQAQRIAELETEKQLSATQALLQGQEDERSRMAKELHDGLGGLLSGVKLNLNNMDKKLIITEEDGASFEKSISLLDESISELRRVAHNLMPESILKFGLDGAIREFLQTISSPQLHITYQSYHIENGMSKMLDISTYRIVQELVHNVLKHAQASEILVQVRKDEQLLVIDVEDNGKGFDADTERKENGMGLAGIQSRVTYWKGTWQISSSETSGTSVHIEIPV